MELSIAFNLTFSLSLHFAMFIASNLFTVDFYTPIKLIFTNSKVDTSRGHLTRFFIHQNQPMNFSKSAVAIRLAQSGDSDRIAQLCHQLGYTESIEAVQKRLDQLQQTHHSNVVYVAETETAGVIGWIHLYICQVLMADRMGVVGGLVVDTDFRQQGIGKLLLRYAKQWASTQGCQEILVRSNVRRHAAHQFYLRNGFQEIKRSVVFCGSLED